MHEIQLKAGEKRRVFARFSSSLAGVIEFEAEVVRSGDELAGTVEVHGSNWIIPKEPRSQPLVSSNRVEKGAWDSSFSIWVIPEVDVRLRMRGSKVERWFWIMIAIAMLIVLAAGAVIVVSQR